MATQGIVSVIQSEQVVYKLVAGCNGFHAPALAARLEIRCPGTVSDLIKLAQDLAFGCERCLVVQAADGDFGPGTEEEDLSPLYREKFSDPRFNPRWKKGTAEHTCIAHVEWGDHRKREKCV